MKLKDLATELGLDPHVLKTEIEEEFGLKLKKITDKISDEIINLLRDRYAKKEEVIVTQKEEKGIKAFDLYHELGITLNELEEKLREVGFTKEISNLTVIDEDTVNKVRNFIKEEKRRKEEEIKRLEEEKRKREEEKKKEVEEVKPKEEVVEKVEEIEKEKVKEEIKEEIPEVIEGIVEEEVRTFRRDKKPFEKREERPFKKKEEFERKEKKPFEKREDKPFKKKEEFERKEKKPFEKREEKTFERKEKYEKRSEERPQQREEKRKLEKPKEQQEITIVPQSIKEDKRLEKKETKEEREERLTKEQKEEMEALRKLMESHPKKKKQPKKEEKEKEEIEEKEEIKIVQIPEVITVRELADLLNLPVNQVLLDLLKRKILATVNQIIDPKIALEIAEEHGFLAEIKEEGVEEETEATIVEEEKSEESSEDLVERPPIVTVMGHVDHGKTTLLDTIRKTDVAAKEHGGITQHIGAYKIKLPNGKEITFLDTPGHEAFTTLRARGSKVADIAVLVVAADDGVKPQTVEAINHAKNAKVPIIVAVNKIDKPGADPLRVRQELTQYNIIPEEWGGDTIFVDISAKTGKNIDQLLEMILLVAEMLELKANPNKLGVGTVIESKLDPKKGPVATVLVENGTLKVGDYFVAGYSFGKIKALLNEKGERLKEAGPGTPVEVLGFDEVPQAGDKFIVKATEREAKQLAEIRKQKREEELLAKKTRIHLENLSEVKEINIILKADVQGSLEALKKSIEDLSNKFEEVSINIIHAAVGGITESDVMLAAASNAIIIGFNVRPDAGARKTAEEENVDIRIYNIIYQAIEDLEKAMKGMLAPTTKEVLLGTAEVRAVFKAKSIGTIAGCYVTEGIIKRNAKARLVRNGIVIYDGEINSLKRFKEDVKEVQKGFECGLTLKNFNDIKVGDIIEAYEIVEERPQ